jgi:CO/xanthine dehydrogenase FAD-binding subunit
MKPAAFEYERPASVEAAVAALALHRDNARVLAGGQSLIPMLNLRLVQVGRLIDIGRLDGLRRVEVVGDELRIGALTTHNVLLTSPLVAERCPLIVEAYHEVAHHSVRNRGTLGGSLCHNDPASEMPLVMSVLGATLAVRSARGERLLKTEDFFVGMFTTALEPDELLVQIRVPLSAPGLGYGFHEIAQRKGDFALVAGAAVLRVTGGVCRDVRIGFRNVGADSIRLPAVEAELEGIAPSAERIAKAAETAAAAVNPPEDLHATAEYRRDLVRVVTERMLAQGVARAVKA